MSKQEENYGQLRDFIELVMWPEESISGITLAEKAERFGVTRRTGPRLHCDETVAQTLREALRSFRQVSITYVNRAGHHRDFILIPLGFLYGERLHYLVARRANGYMADVAHHFILSRIRSAKMLEADFEEDPSFSLAAYAVSSFGGFQEEPFEIEWLFSHEAASEAESYLFHPSQEMSRSPDGSLSVRFPAGGRLEMAWLLYT